VCPDVVQASPFSATAPGERLATYSRLAEQGPVQRVKLPNGQPAWLVLHYDAVRQALADPRLIKSPPHAPAAVPALPPEIASAMSNDLLHLDPPDHTRLRRLVAAAFTRRRVDAQAPRIAEIADELLDGMVGADEVDLLDAYAFPLPMTVIGELLGVPSGDTSEFRRWSNTLVTGSLAGHEVWIAAATDLVAYVRTLLALKRRSPAEDLLSALVAIRDGEDRLSEDELTSMVFLLLLAGHETTVNLIANGVLTLLEHPVRLASVRAEPERMGAVIEEILRFEGPLQVATLRYAAEPVELAGVTIPAGDIVVPSVLTANRDRRRFPDPDGFDPARGDNPHLAFGHGVHFCLGAPLARIEGRIALGRLLARFPRLRLAVPADQLTWRPSFLMHGLSRLPVALR
jgi:cytochrome P450